MPKSRYLINQETDLRWQQWDQKADCRIWFYFIQIFTDRSESEPLTERMRPDTVIDYLHAFPKAVMRYLEHLVFTKKLEVSLEAEFVEGVEVRRSHETTGKSGGQSLQSL